MFGGGVVADAEVCDRPSCTCMAASVLVRGRQQLGTTHQHQDSTFMNGLIESAKELSFCRALAFWPFFHACGI
jgi:hypothetical protein